MRPRPQSNLRGCLRLLPQIPSLSHSSNLVFSEASSKLSSKRSHPPQPPRPSADMHYFQCQKIMNKSNFSWIYYRKCKNYCKHVGTPCRKKIAVCKNCTSIYVYCFDGMKVEQKTDSSTVLTESKKGD